MNEKHQSFLYSLLAKYRKSTENSLSELDEEGFNELAMPFNSDALAQESLLESKKNSADGALSEISEADMLAQKAYLQPLLDMLGLWRKSGKSVGIIGNVLDYESWLFEPVVSNEYFEKYLMDIKLFLREICRQSDNILRQFKLEFEKYELSFKQYNDELVKAAVNNVDFNSMENIPKTPKLDSNIYIKLSKDKLVAFIFITPGLYGGTGVTKEAIDEALIKNKIQYGISEEAIDEIIKDNKCLQLYIIASGLKSIAGNDGEIIDMFARTREMTINEDENGIVDFKNTGLIKSIKKGDVICKIIPPTDGVDGVNVSGQQIPAKKGRNASVPMGKDTELNAEGNMLLASMDGHVTFELGRFNVKNVYIVNGNIDYSVGNIDFPGDVVIRGDVVTGFVIKAGGDISVGGMVEGATLISEGNITIEKGMNGNRLGILSARGDVKSRFLENSTVSSGGCVYSESIISCDVSCEDTVYAISNKGIIIGGKLTALNSVEAKMIGSKSFRETIIVLGELPGLVTKRNDYKAQLKNVVDVLEKLEKNISYLRQLKEMPPEKIDVFNQLIQQQGLYSVRKKELLDELYELSKKGTDFSNCRLKSNMIFPPTKLTIGGRTKVVDTILFKSMMYLGKEDIVEGSL